MEQPPRVRLFLSQKQTKYTWGSFLVEANYNLKGTKFSHPQMRGDFLREISPSDERWDNFRKQADKFKNLYSGTEYDRYAQRIDGCSGLLEFNTIVDPETGESKLKLKSARFCRVPRCPVCQWRRSLMWRAKAFKVIPKIFEAYPSARFIFLTLTVRNCPLDELRLTLSQMNAAWQRLTQRKQFPGVGWIKAVEVTRVWDCYDGDKFVGRHGSTWVETWEIDNGKKLRLVSTNECHPHFHCLLMVNPGYFTGKYYLSQEKWTVLWQKSLRVEYIPIVHVQAVKSKTGANQGMLDAVLETIKYSVKPNDVIRLASPGEVSDRDWLVELTRQLYKTKSIATGGLLKSYLKDLESEPDDLIHADVSLDSESMDKTVVLFFNWNQWIGKYLLQSYS